MACSITSFGTTETGREAHLYTLENEAGMSVTLTDMGACVVSVRVPDAHGGRPDVCLGYDGLADYEHNGACFGALVGRNANRIAGASFMTFGWVTLGVLYGAITPLFILAYYGVVGGWTLIYVWKSVTGQLNVQTVAEATAVMTPIIMTPKGYWATPLVATLVFMLTTAAIIWIGVQKGIERFSKIFMPLLALLLVVLIFRGLTLEGASKGLRFLFVPDFSQLSGRSCLCVYMAKISFGNS